MQNSAETQWKVFEEANDFQLDLVAKSPFDQGRRVYRIGENAWKVVCKSLTTSQSKRRANLEQEYKILECLDGAQIAPRPLGFFAQGDFEWIAIEWIHGRKCGSKKGLVPNIQDLCKAWNALNRLSCLGISHGDVRPSNLLFNDAGQCIIIDFDQATNVGRFNAFISNIVGVAKSGRTISFLYLCRVTMSPIIPRLLKSPVRALRRAVSRHRRLPNSSQCNTPALEMLRRAWELGQRSNANAPNASVCYYRVEESGLVFPGERPWKDRWSVLRKVVDFEGKRVLELGCNLGLLSTWLLRHEGASQALCVDHDPEILSAAALTARAYEQTPMFCCVDFDQPSQWEKSLIQFEPEIVFALSVFNWVTDKDRFLRFLSRFPLVIIESHETFELERERMSPFGFDVSLVAYSERDRPVVKCRKI